MKLRLILVTVLILSGSVMIFGQSETGDPVPAIIVSAATILAGIAGFVFKWGPAKTSTARKALIGLHKIGLMLVGLFNRKKK
jgi:protein-S-isoprenylcysteine O-methyltransferase Ste14